MFMDRIDLEGTLASGAAAASWGTFETQIFAIGDDGQLANRYWDGEAWHAWEPWEGRSEDSPPRRRARPSGASGASHPARAWAARIRAEPGTIR
jgi:hypothetical protein